MFKRILLSFIVLMALAAVPLAACNPNPALMQDGCYSSCANWAETLQGQCKGGCTQQYCSWENGQFTCSNFEYYAACNMLCDQENCRSLDECADYCHEWLAALLRDPHKHKTPGKKK